MLQRIKQFFRAIFAQKTNKQENGIIKKYLSGESEKLFRAMTIPDQRHSLNVYYTALKLVADRKIDIDIALLARCCLLHDVGRGSFMGTCEKVLTVLLVGFFPAWSVEKSKQENGYIANILYRYYNHPAIGAKILEGIGLKQEASIIKYHHARDTVLSITDSERTIFSILREADGRN